MAQPFNPDDLARLLREQERLLLQVQPSWADVQRHLSALAPAAGAFSHLQRELSRITDHTRTFGAFTEELQRTADLSGWLTKLPPNPEIGRCLRVVEELANAVRVTLGDTTPAWLNRIQESADQLSQFSLGLETAMEQLALKTAPLTQVGHLFTRLPDIGELLKQWHQAAAARAKQALRETGYGFAMHLWATSLIVTFAWNNPNGLAPVVSRRVLSYTRAAAFEERLDEQLQTSPRLKRRRTLILSALAAHRRREYLLVIPALLAQIEGIIADALIVKGQITRRGRKLHPRGLDGKLKLNKKHQPIEITGMQGLLQYSDFPAHPILRGIAELLSNQLIRDRNAILHGHRTAYASAKLATQCFLAILVLAIEFVALEATTQ
jgi:hypothetical protein